MLDQATGATEDAQPHGLTRLQTLLPAQSLGLSDKTLQQLRTLFDAESAIGRVIVYGSRAKGQFREGSDIDLSLDAPDLNFERLLVLRGALDDSSIPQTVDLSVLQQLDSAPLLAHIQRVGKVLYERRTADA